ncbi:MAG TPA: sigma-54-dependent Fis family transcriptional regulator [Thermodesulfatator atlanticus]|uniref:Sigma-54-dependent Fis family transcriptional regulator n=1 Tax=Thermodesulfatator atlanticus TaxID=501497 RepID=A0A7V5U2F8_9BACT|nr:sigma-54-dependent Fis family transcriptional regulator [Thermodesulfatator atlanticus]
MTGIWGVAFISQENQEGPLKNIVGQSAAIRRIKDLILQVADTDLSVVIYGESGVGKEVVARTLYACSHRARGPFVKVNCAAIPGDLLESELFGYERGAFTGAERAKPGKFELANGGVIFLDEIGDLPHSLQSKLLQVLQDQEFCRLGGQREIKVDVWVISATNHDLEKEVEEGKFRQDLYYRLNVIKVHVPPLRERKEDIPLLCDYFVKLYRNKYNVPDFELPRYLLDLFMQYHWPGNVRELENYIKRLVVLGDFEEVEREIRSFQRALKPQTPPVTVEDETAHKIALELARAEQGQVALKEVKKRVVALVEKRIIDIVLRQTEGNKRQAANLLGISYKALLYKIREFEEMGL